MDCRCRLCSTADRKKGVAGLLNLKPKFSAVSERYDSRKRKSSQHLNRKFALNIEFRPEGNKGIFRPAWEWDHSWKRRKTGGPSKKENQGRAGGGVLPATGRTHRTGTKPAATGKPLCRTCTASSKPGTVSFPRFRFLKKKSPLSRGSFSLEKSSGSLLIAYRSPPRIDRPYPVANVAEHGVDVVRRHTQHHHQHHHAADGIQVYAR